MNKEEKYEYCKKALKEHIKYYDSLKKAFYDYYGEENVDFQDSSTLQRIEQCIKNDIELDTLEPHDEGFLDYVVQSIIDMNATINVIIKRGDFKITNEAGLSHDIKEFWIKFNISLSGTLLTEPTFARSLYTLRELDSKYTHSHISTSANITTFNTFCFGNNPIIGVFIYFKNSRHQDIWEWVSMFKQLDDTIKTESLSGGPYIKMQRIQEDWLNSFIVDEFKLNDFILNKMGPVNTDLDLNIETKKRVLCKLCKDYINNERLSYNFNPISGVKLNVSPKEFILKIGYYFYKELEKYDETEIKMIEKYLEVEYCLLTEKRLSILKSDFKLYLNPRLNNKIETTDLTLEHDFKGEKVYIKKQHDSLNTENLAIIKLPSLCLIKQSYNIITDILNYIFINKTSYENLLETKWFL